MLTEAERHEDQTTIFGFWVYLMTDALLFASLFAIYAVLHNTSFGSPTGAELFNAPFVLAETIILLASSFTCGLGILSAYKDSKGGVISWFSATWLLGLAFLVMELNEFSSLIRAGHSYASNGFLSSYFTLVGTHGLHITIGLIWIAIMIASVAFRGLTRSTKRRLMLASLFWHFLDIIWIFIFTLVYLMAFK